MPKLISKKVYILFLATIILLLGGVWFVFKKKPFLLRSPIIKNELISRQNESVLGYFTPSGTIDIAPDEIEHWVVTLNGQKGVNVSVDPSNAFTKKTLYYLPLKLKSAK